MRLPHRLSALALLAVSAPAAAQEWTPDAAATRAAARTAAVGWDVAPDDLLAAERLGRAAVRCEAEACRADVAGGASGKVCRAAVLLAVFRHRASLPAAAPAPRRYDTACGAESVAVEVRDSTVRGGKVRLATLTHRGGGAELRRSLPMERLEEEATAAEERERRATAARAGAIAAFERERAAARAAGDEAALRKALVGLAEQHQTYFAGADGPPPAAEGEPRPATAVFTVASVEPVAAGSWRAILHAGWRQGAVPGARGRLLVAYRRGDAARAAVRPVGTAEVVLTDPTTSQVLLRVTEARVVPLVGDLVELTYRAPGAAHRSVWRELAERAVLFRGRDQALLAHPAYLARADDAELERDLLRVAAADVRATAAAFRARVAERPELAKPLETGRYRGVTLLDAMQRATPETVAEFLRLVLAVPGKYMGGAWKIDETYANWILAGAPAVPPGTAAPRP